MWESIIEFLNNSWLEVTATSGIGLMGFKWLVLDKIKNNKLNLDFVSLRDNLSTKVDKVFTSIDIVFERVEKLTGIVENLTKENAIKDEQIVALSDLVVQSLSIANVPLDQKSKFYDNLNRISIVSDNTKKVLQGVVAGEKQIVEINENIENELDGKLNEV